MYHILVVDDNKLNLDVAKKTLSGSFQVSTVISGSQAIKFLTKRVPDLILLDLYMPEMDGKETLRQIRENPDLALIPVIFLTADSSAETEAECLELGADDFIAKPFVPVVMLRRIKRTIELHSLRTGLEEQLKIKTRQLERITLNSITVIANTIDAKDKYTSGHSLRVAKCSEEIAKRMGWDEQDIHNLHYVSLLHDIGKIGVPDSILNKQSRLTDEEFAVIKRHPVIGGEILKDIRIFPHVDEGAMYHHERYDGKGYPYGLKGEDIPITARIVCIADSYDAMTSNRVYRKAISRENVIAEFERCLGTQFDPEIGQIFVDMLKEGFVINENEIQTELAGDNTDKDEGNLLLSKFISEYTADIKETSQKDPLTGVYNRAYMEQMISQVMANDVPGAFLMLDMDNFKYVNDYFGHIVGDQTLKIFADTLLDSTSENDFVGRVGGDEFIVFIKGNTDRKYISQIAEKIITTLQKRLDEYLTQSVTSVSIGIAMAPDDGNDFITLYKNADRALYHIKENGKNSFHFFRDKEKTSKRDSINADLATVQKLLEGNINTSKGAYKIRYSDFQNVYNFISRYIDRNHPVVQIILFTLHDEFAGVSEPETAENAMVALENSIVTSIRGVDVTTRYSSVQYIVVLMDANLENGKNVADRIIKTFKSSYIRKKVEITYDIETVTPNPNRI